MCERQRTYDVVDARVRHRQVGEFCLADVSSGQSLMSHIEHRLRGINSDDLVSEAEKVGGMPSCPASCIEGDARRQGIQ